MREVRLDGPAWFAARIDSTAKIELDRQLFARTSPVYVDFAGKGVFDVDAARLLLRRVEESRAAIRSRGKFGEDTTRDKILAIYDETTKELAKRISQRGS